MDNILLHKPSDIIKSNLIKFYNQDAKRRNESEKQEWKLTFRKEFCDIALKENKKTLLELGAGAGYDSVFFQEQGFDVIAIDLSGDMVELCINKGISAYVLDFYNLFSIGKKFDCIWAMNSLLHVPKSEIKDVLYTIDSVLNEDGLFYMGVYGGRDSEEEHVNEISDVPRFFSRFTKDNLYYVLNDIFDIVDFVEIEVDTGFTFQSILMRKNTK